MIASYLIPKLQERFPGRGLQPGVPPAPCAVFPAIHPEVGNLEIYDDGQELTVVAGHFTHGHFSNYEDGLTEGEKAIRIVEEVLDFLEATFADQLVFWGSHENAGGWFARHEGDTPWSKGEKKYVWSGPLPTGDPET